MSVCDFCGECVGMHEIIDDDASCGMAMVCDICFARSGGVFAETTDERMGEIIMNRGRSLWDGLVDIDSLEVDGVRVWPNGRVGQGEK